MFLYSADFVKRRNYAGEQSWWDLPIDIDNELFEDTRNVGCILSQRLVEGTQSVFAKVMMAWIESSPARGI